MNTLPEPPLNSIPWGLLDLFGIKSMGRNPQHLDKVVYPSIELLPWYVAARQTHHTLTRANLTAVNSANQFYAFSSATLGLPTTVPQTEWWLISNYAMRWRSGGATGIGVWGGFNLAVSRVGATASVDQCLPCTFSGNVYNSPSVEANQGQVICHQPPDGFTLLSPNTQLGWWASALIVPAGEEIAVEGTISVVRLSS